MGYCGAGFTRDRSSGLAYEGSHTPLTTFATWMNVQEILDGRSISNVHGNRHEFTYTGLMTCGHCGCAMTAEIKKRQVQSTITAPSSKRGARSPAFEKKRWT